MMNKLASFAFALVSAVGAAHGAQVAFSGNSTGPAPTANAIKYSALPGQTVTVYIWAGRTATTGFVNTLGLNVKAVAVGASNRVALPDVSFTWDNPSVAVTDPETGELVDYLYRWDSVVAPSYNVNGMAVYDARAFTTASSAAATFSPLTTMRKVATMTFTMPSTLIELYLGVSPFWISESTGTTTSTFGFGDAPILSTGQASSNTFSALPDLVTVGEPDPNPDAPEPASIGLLGLGLAGLAARPRRSQ